MKQVILITGASSGFGAITDRALAQAGHTVYASMRETTGRNQPQVEAVKKFAADKHVDLRTVELDVSSQGLVVWVGSSSTRGGTPPYLAPYFAAKAGMDAIAVSYAGELARWNIETVIIVPGAYTSGTNHFAHAGKPEDVARAKEYEGGPTATLAKEIMDGLARTAVPDADVSEVAKAIVDVVDMPFGHRPFRVHIDPANDGAEIVNGVADSCSLGTIAIWGCLTCPTFIVVESCQQEGVVKVLE